eukprot:jgi/Chlat1/1637/Chrsp127S08673
MACAIGSVAAGLKLNSLAPTSGLRPAQQARLARAGSLGVSSAPSTLRLGAGRRCHRIRTACSASKDAKAALDDAGDAGKRALRDAENAVDGAGDAGKRVLQDAEDAVEGARKTGKDFIDDTKVTAQKTVATAVQTPVYSKEFLNSRIVTFAGIFIGYGSYYLTRNSLTFVAPVMMNDPALGLSLAQVGGLTSIMPVAYGISKFLSGVLGSRTSPVQLLAGGLMATAVVNIAFGFGSAYLWFCTLWAANGVLQGLGAPACARLLTSWFASKERGTYWGFWTASNNVGGFAAPLLAGYAAKHYGWRWGMYAPGLVGIVVGLLLLTAMKDSPESQGFAPVEQAAKKAVAAMQYQAILYRFDTHLRWCLAATGAKPPSMMESLREEVLKNKYVWLFAITYFFVYVVRQGVTSWFIFYLLKAKGVTDAATAAVRVSGLELGKLSDYLISKNTSGKDGNVGLRVKVVMAYSALTAAFLFLFSICPNVSWMQWLNVTAVGFALYGPQMLIGLAGAECVSRNAVGACQGFLGWISYLGAANAGAPLAMVVQKYGWGVYFTTLISACVICLVLLLPMMNLKSYVQQEAAKTA